MNQANIKKMSGRHCVFCKYWYDPTNSAIRPKAPNIGIWEYDGKAEAKCLKKNIDMKAFALCSKYECKL